MEFINHFVNGIFQPRPSQLSPEEIGKVYDNFVPVAIDVVPIVFSARKILLGLRSQEPKIWWTVGRTVRPGESPSQTVNRILFEEFRMRMDENELVDRLGFVCINSSVVAIRDQPPQENGRHCFIIVLSLNVNENDMQQYVICDSKYREVKWFFLSQINTRDFNQVICEIVRRLR